MIDRSQHCREILFCVRLERGRSSCARKKRKIVYAPHRPLCVNQCCVCDRWYRYNKQEGGSPCVRRGKTTFTCNVEATPPPSILFPCLLRLHQFTSRTSFFLRFINTSFPRPLHLIIFRGIAGNPEKMYVYRSSVVPTVVHGCAARRSGHLKRVMHRDGVILAGA